MLRTALGSYVSSRGALGAIAALYVPLAVLVAIIGMALSFPAAQTTSAVLTAGMSFLVIALVTAYWHLESSGEERSLTESVHLVRDRIVPLIWTVGLASVVVVVLALTIVGIPLSIRQLVRYQFVSPVVVTESMSGRDALRRSGELVQGRWWRTAMTMVLLLGIAGLINSAIQLGLLVVLGGLPLWAYVAITFAATGLIVPMVSTGPILLYGDAASRRPAV